MRYRKTTDRHNLVAKARPLIQSANNCKPAATPTVRTNSKQVHASETSERRWHSSASYPNAYCSEGTLLTLTLSLYSTLYLAVSWPWPELLHEIVNLWNTGPTPSFDVVSPNLIVFQTGQDQRSYQSVRHASKQ